MDIFEVLRADPPGDIHADLAQTATTYGASPSVLRWLADTVRPEWRTLETGSGLSTIVITSTGAQHTAVSPFGSEHERIKRWCEEHGIAHDNVTFVAAPSEDVLPARDLGELDLVMIDGSHSFPQVFIDWFYAVRALKDGGLVVVDDTNLWTGAVLRDFLREEPGWTTVEDWRFRTSVFRKGPGADPDRAWNQQPYVEKRSATVEGTPAAAVAGLVRRRQFAFLYWRLRNALGR